MGKRQCDCRQCGAPVGIIGRDLCCRCVRRLREMAAKAPCPGCEQERVLVPETGWCQRCSHRCLTCGGPVRAKDSSTCWPCERQAANQARKRTCPRCGREGFLREQTGWCGTCSRPGPGKDPPRICQTCGQLRRHAGLGLCSACLQRNPDRPFVTGANLAARLPDPPNWLADFVVYVAARHGPSRTCQMLGKLGQVLADDQSNLPQAVLERCRRPGRSIGSLARALEGFFVQRHLAIATDQAHQRAAERRRRRLQATPESLRPCADAFASTLLQQRERARRAGTKPRTDHTIEVALAVVRDFAQHLHTDSHKTDWALVDVQDVEAFLNLQPRNRNRRLLVLRQFFRFARTNRTILIDATRRLSAKQHKSFIGKTVPLQQQRQLFRRWTGDDSVHPHEALLGILALLHGATGQEVRLLRCADIDADLRTVRLGQRPRPVPLDPPTWQAIQRCLRHRQQQRTDNPHLVVTRGTKAGQRPASGAYFSHLLDACPVTTPALRSTRLINLVNTLDPKLTAAAMGMTSEAMMIYLADQIDDTRLPESDLNH